MLVTAIVLVLALILIIMVGYSFFIAVKKNQNRDHRLKKIQRRLEEIEAQKAMDSKLKEDSSR